VHLSFSSELERGTASLERGTASPLRTKLVTP